MFLQEVQMTLNPITHLNKNNKNLHGRDPVYIQLTVCQKAKA